MTAKEGLIVILDAASRLIQRGPKRFARMAVYNGRCADAAGVEMRVERKDDGTASVALNVYDPRTGDWTSCAQLTLVPPTCNGQESKWCKGS